MIALLNWKIIILSKIIRMMRIMIRLNLKVDWSSVILLH